MNVFLFFSTKLDVIGTSLIGTSNLSLFSWLWDADRAWRSEEAGKDDLKIFLGSADIVSNIALVYHLKETEETWDAHKIHSFTFLR